MRYKYFLDNIDEEFNGRKVYQFSNIVESLNGYDGGDSFYLHKVEAKKLVRHNQVLNAILVDNEIVMATRMDLLMKFLMASLNPTSECQIVVKVLKQKDLPEYERIPKARIVKFRIGVEGYVNQDSDDWEIIDNKRSKYQDITQLFCEIISRVITTMRLDDKGNIDYIYNSGIPLEEWIKTMFNSEILDFYGDSDLMIRKRPKILYKR